MTDEEFDAAFDRDVRALAGKPRRRRTLAQEIARARRLIARGSKLCAAVAP